MIHRDIKPENLLLTDDGNTLVADFGIARALGASADEKLTETGLVVGTPAYMSPEQAAGDKGLDARTDIYSLAAVLYEMLAGEPPFTGATTQAMLVRRLSRAGAERAVGADQPAGERGPGDPEGAVGGGGRPLRDDGAVRPGAAGRHDDAVPATPTVVTTPPTGTPPITTSAVAPSRRSTVPAAAILVLGILIGLGVLFAWRRSTPTCPPVRERLAVLPFENVGDSTEEYFADGITDAVRGKLTGLPGLEVIAGSSSLYKHTDKDLTQIARELGVTTCSPARCAGRRARTVPAGCA